MPFDADRLPRIRELHDPKWFPYRFGHALWAFLADQFGEDIAGRALALQGERRRDRPAGDGDRRSRIDS